jgi:hypothetical protein
MTRAEWRIWNVLTDFQCLVAATCQHSPYEKWGERPESNRQFACKIFSEALVKNVVPSARRKLVSKSDPSVRAEVLFSLDSMSCGFTICPLLQKLVKEEGFEPPIYACKILRMDLTSKSCEGDRVEMLRL